MRSLQLSNITAAEFSHHGPLLHAEDPRPTEAQLAGLRYEQRVLSYFCEKYGPTFIPSPWIRYRTKAQPWWRYAQPDAFLLDLPLGRIIIVEVKMRHTDVAWQQLRRLYEPLLRFIFDEPSWQFSCCEVVRAYDGRIEFPERFTLCDDFYQLRPDQFGLFCFL